MLPFFPFREGQFPLQLVNNMFSFRIMINHDLVEVPLTHLLSRKPTVFCTDPCSTEKPWRHERKRTPITWRLEEEDPTNRMVCNMSNPRCCFCDKEYLPSHLASKKSLGKCIGIHSLPSSPRPGPKRKRESIPTIHFQVRTVSFRLLYIFHSHGFPHEKS